jgi:hypothetical protein
MTDTDLTTKMHEAHLTWRADHAAWRDEAAGWCAHYEAVVADLRLVEAKLLEASEAVRAHVATLEAHERALAVHEHELASLEARCGDDRYVPATIEHQSSSDQHGEEAAAQQRLKARYHAILSLVRKLERAADAAPRA